LKFFLKFLGHRAVLDLHRDVETCCVKKQRNRSAGGDAHDYGLLDSETCATAQYHNYLLQMI